MTVSYYTIKDPKTGADYSPGETLPAAHLSQILANTRDLKIAPLRHWVRLIASPAGNEGPLYPKSVVATGYVTSGAATGTWLPGVVAFHGTGASAAICAIGTEPDQETNATSASYTGAYSCSSGIFSSANFDGIGSCRAYYNGQPGVVVPRHGKNTGAGFAYSAIRYGVSAEVATSANASIPGLNNTQVGVCYATSGSQYSFFAQSGNVIHYTAATSAISTVSAAYTGAISSQIIAVAANGCRDLVYVTSTGGTAASTGPSRYVFASGTGVVSGAWPPNGSGVTLTTPSIGTHLSLSYCPTNGVFVLLTTQGIYTSATGASWTQKLAITYATHLGVSNDGVWVIAGSLTEYYSSGAGSASSPMTVVHASSDGGATWHFVASLPDNLASNSYGALIEYCQGKFYIPGDRYTWQSTPSACRY